MQKLTDYVMTAEAAEILSVSQNTLRAWARDGKIPMHWNPANGYRRSSPFASSHLCVSLLHNFGADLTKKGITRITMNLTPASLKTQRRKDLKDFTDSVYRSASHLCVLA